jgi:hypothetical protein
MIYDQTFSLEQYVKPSTSKTPPLFGDLLHPPPKFPIFIRERFMAQNVSA